MRDPGEFRTRKGTPWIVIISRVIFAVYFLYFLYALYAPPTTNSTLNIFWWGYLLVLYGVAEKLYARFRDRNIDMAFAFPLLLVVYLMNLGSMLLGGQEALPIMNRIEHFAPFVLLAYALSVFFYQYLPQGVWRKHPYYTSLLVLALTSLFGVGNEIVELFFDAFFLTHHVGNTYDTSLDLLMNTLGSGSLLAMHLLLRPKPKRKR